MRWTKDFDDSGGTSLVAAVVDAEDGKYESLSEGEDEMVVLDNTVFAFDSVTVSSSAGSSPIGTLAFDANVPFADASTCLSESVFAGLVTVLDPGVARAFETFAALMNRPLAPLLNIEYVLRSDSVGVEGIDASRIRARASDISCGGEQALNPDSFMHSFP
jgi:hypothetical protein